MALKRRWRLINVEGQQPVQTTIRRIAPMIGLIKHTFILGEYGISRCKRTPLLIIYSQVQAALSS